MQTHTQVELQAEVQTGTPPDTSFDVLILGGSIAASTAALTLTGQGLRVALIDKGVHPRFALGESLLKPTVLWMRMLAARYNVDALNVVSNLDRIHREIGTSSGVKKCFGFVRHEPGNDTLVDRWWSNVAMSYGENVIEAHLFRQDIDAYLFHTATRECAAVLAGASAKSIDIDDDGVRITLTDRVLQGQFLLDCTGPTSVIAKQLGWREDSPRYRTDSRSIFTHMIDMAPFDDCEPGATPALDWHEGTLHHVLDGAWIWVIPFDNHPGSTNPLVSVGVTYDNRRHPPCGLSAEQEWAELLDSYPLLKRQFGNAKTVRPWISTGRLQYSAHTSTGDRVALLGAACGGIDALFSRGLLNTMQSIHLISELLPDMVREQDFRAERLAPLETLQHHLLEINDLLTFGALSSFDDTRLISWWLSVWTWVEQRSIALADQALASLDPGCEDPEQARQALLGVSIADESLALETLRDAIVIMDQYEAGDIDAERTHRSLIRLSMRIERSGFFYPVFKRLIHDLGFHPRSRALLQVEHGLVAVIDELDRQWKLPRPLRSEPLVMSLVRLISAETSHDSVRVDCPHRSQDRSKDSSQDKPVVPEVAGVSGMALSGESLRTRLADTVRRWVTDSRKQETTLERCALIQSIRYRHSSVLGSDTHCSVQTHDVDEQTVAIELMAEVGSRQHCCELVVQRALLDGLPDGLAGELRNDRGDGSGESSGGGSGGGLFESLGGNAARPASLTVQRKKSAA